MSLGTPGPGFQPQFCAVSCALCVQDKWLFLKRSPHRIQGGQWGFPTGKTEPGESLEAAIQREVREEIGIDLNPIEPFRHYAVTWGTVKFDYHLFYSHFERMPYIQIDPREHSDFIWLEPLEALSLNLVDDAPEILKDLYKHLK